MCLLLYSSFYSNCLFFYQFYIVKNKQTRLGADYDSDHEVLIEKFRLKF